MDTDYDVEAKRKQMQSDMLRVNAEWNKDCFLYRILPFTCAGFLGLGVLKSRGFTPSPVWGMGVVVGSSVLGVYSYAAEFRRRMARFKPKDIVEVQAGGVEISPLSTQVSSYSVDEVVPGQIQYHAGEDSYSLPLPDLFPYTNARDSLAATDSVNSCVRVPRTATTYDDLREQNRRRYVLSQSKAVASLANDLQQKQQQLSQLQTKPEISKQTQHGVFEGQQQPSNVYNDTSFS